MPRIRTIKPAHWSDKELAKISLQAHLLWIGMWNFSDDEGVIEADPLLIRSNIFPRRTDIRLDQVSQWLDQLVKARFLIPFNHQNESYYVSRTFKTHQKIDRPQPSKIPSEILQSVFDEYSTNDRPSIVEESKVKESNGEASPLPLPPLKKVEKIDSKAAYKKIQESLVEGLPNAEIWTRIKGFIAEHKPVIPDPFVDLWNLFAHSYKLPKVEAISDSRRKKLSTRLQEQAFDFIKVLENIKSSPHLKGDNQRGWKVSFDWIIENDKNYLKIIEEQYA